MFIISLDQRLTHLIFSLPHPSFINQFFSLMSAVGNYALVWIVVAIFFAGFEEAKNRKFILPFALSIVTTSILVGYVLKPFFARPRPYADVNKTQLADSQPLGNEQQALISTSYPIDKSFPSGHAALSFTAAAVIGYFNKKRLWFFYIVATFIAFSRVWLGVHYLGDIVAGAFVGWLVARLVLAMKIQKKTAPCGRKEK